MDELGRILIETQSCSKDNRRRIEALERRTDEIHELAMSVRDLAGQVNRMVELQERQGERIYALENEPAQRWNNMIKTIITTILSTLTIGIVGAIIAMLGK